MSPRVLSLPSDFVSCFCQQELYYLSLLYSTKDEKNIKNTKDFIPTLLWKQSICHIKQGGGGGGGNKGVQKISLAPLKGKKKTFNSPQHSHLIVKVLHSCTLQSPKKFDSAQNNYCIAPVTVRASIIIKTCRNQQQQQKNDSLVMKWFDWNDIKFLQSAGQLFYDFFNL